MEPTGHARANSDDKRVKKHLSFVVASMAGGGAERSTIELVKYLAILNYKVDLVIRNFTGPLLQELPNNVHIVVTDKYFASRKFEWACSIPSERIMWVCKSDSVKFLDFTRHVILCWPLGLRVIPRASNRYVTSSYSLSEYFATSKPDIVVATLANDFFCSIVGLRIAQINTIVVCSIHGTLAYRRNTLKRLRAYQIYKRLLGKADWVHTVSEGSRIELVTHELCSKYKASTIYNAVARPEIKKLSVQISNHEWVDRSVRGGGVDKLVLAVGSLTRVKNHNLLVDAFAAVAQTTNAKLIILGEGEEREKIEHQVHDLKIGDLVSLPGWVANPFPFMRRCDVFVLSSLSEGLPNVLIEALFCGCSIVSTDCPYGPREILENGKYGTLVPSDDEGTLAEAIRQMLEQPLPESLQKQRAARFTMNRIGPEYVNLFESLYEQRKFSEIS